MKIKNVAKKIVAGVLAIALAVGAAPAHSTELVKADTYNSYETIVKLTEDYDSIEGIYNQYAIVCKDDLYGVIDFKGNELLECKYSEISKSDYTEKLFVIDENDYCYLLNKNGSTITLGQYINCKELSNGMIYVSYKNDDYNIVSKLAKVEGTELVDVTGEYDSIMIANNGNNYIASEDGENYVLLDLEENVVADFGQCLFAGEISDGMFLSMNMDEEYNVEWNLVKYDGETVSKIIDSSEYTELNITSDGQYLLVQDKDLVWHLMDNSGNNTGIQYGEYNGMAEIAEGIIGGTLYSESAEDSYLDLFDLEGNKLLSVNGLADVVGGKYILNLDGDGQWTLSDFTGKEIAAYEGITYLSDASLLGKESALLAEEEDEIGLISYDGTWIVALGVAEYISDINEGYFAMRTNGAWEICKLTSKATPPEEETSTKEEETTPEVTTTPEITTTAKVATTTPTVTTAQTTKTAETTTVKVSVPTKAKLKKAKAGKKKVSLTIQKVKSAVGYRVQYSTSKKFKNAKKLTSKKTKVTVKKLKSGKKYYFRVKAYKLDGKTKVYSSKWSNVKSAKVK